MAKASKKRPCPAARAEISAADCGEGRNSRFRCPADCRFNPFANENYDQLLAIEDGLDARTYARMDRDDRGQEGRISDKIRAMAGSPVHAQQATALWHLFFQPDAAGLTAAQRWEKEGFPGLSNDERNLFRAKMQMRVVLFEIHRIIDHQRVEVVDLLDERRSPLIFVDRSLAARAVRFGTLLGWAFPLPDLWRISGAAVALSDLGPFGPDEILAETARHLGAPEPGDARRRWLAENFVRVEESITATAKERLRRMYAAMDATSGHATYELRAPYAECRSVLEKEPALEPAELEKSERAENFKEARNWYDDSPKARALSLNQGRPLLGTVLLRPGTWKVVASTGERLNRLRRLFEQRLGGRVRFISERRDEIGAQLAGKLPATDDPSLIPPRLLEHVGTPVLSTSKLQLPRTMDAGEISQFIRASSWKTYPDEPVPALDGRTPREAANDPALRPQLLQMMKNQVRSIDEENLKSGGTADINPLLRELGLHELDFPPPPRRAVPVEFEDSADDSYEGDELYDDADFLPEAAGPELPPLPAGRPLSVEEAGFRLAASMAAFEFATEALDAMSAAGSTLIDDLFAVTDGLLDFNAFNHVVPLVIPIWFALVPAGAPAPNLSRETLRKALARDLEWIDSLKNPGADAERELQGRRQPHLTLCVIDQCMHALSRAPKKTRLKPETQAIISLVLGTVVEELDRAVRG